MNNKYVPVFITWIDANGGDGWVTYKELSSYELTTHYSIGYLIRADEHIVTITMSYEESDENLGAYLVIPRMNVIDIKYI